MTIRSSHLLEQGPGETGSKAGSTWKLVGMTSANFFRRDFFLGLSFGVPCARLPVYASERRMVVSWLSGALPYILLCSATRLVRPQVARAHRRRQGRKGPQYPLQA